MTCRPASPEPCSTARKAAQPHRRAEQRIDEDDERLTTILGSEIGAYGTNIELGDRLVVAGVIGILATDRLVVAGDDAGHVALGNDPGPLAQYGQACREVRLVRPALARQAAVDQPVGQAAYRNIIGKQARCVICHDFSQK